MVDDDTPVSSTVATSPSGRPPSGDLATSEQERDPLSEVSTGGEAGQRIPTDSSLPEGHSGVSVGLPLVRNSGPPSAMFAPTSEEEDLAVDSGWADEMPPASSVTEATPRSPE